VIAAIVSGSLTGDLGKYNIKLPTADDGIQLALGAEWRQEDADFRPDAASQAGDAAGSGGPTTPVTGGFHVKEVFTEVRVPLAQHLAFADELSVEGGYRYSKYSQGFSTNTYKGGLEWAPVRDLRLRASYQRAVRAPNILELFNPAAVVLDGSTDPCAGVIANGQQPSASQAQCVYAGVSAAQYGHVAPNAASQYNGLLGGNTSLTPETSDTYSAGFIFQPRFAPNLSLSVDYFNIKVKETIGPIGADTILANCVSSHDPVYCSAIHRDANGSLWRSPAGFVSDTNVNFGSLGTRGVDIKANYRISMASAGSLALALEGTKQNDLTVQPLTNGPSYSCTGFYGAKCGAPSPSWRHVFNATWSTPWDAMDIGVRWRYLGSAAAETTSTNPQLAGTPLPNYSHIPSYSYVDLQASFAITKIVRLQLGVNNIADKDPPIVVSGSGGFTSDCPTLSGIGGSSSCNGNTWPGVYDPLGRYLFAHVTVQF
jgi:outer membrane receptor protein involved in Fe transport